MVKNYYKRNYHEALEKITPEFYVADDISLSGTTVKGTDSLLNSHMIVAENIANLINISATDNFSGINSFNEISQYFYPSLNLTKVTPETFDCEILQKFGVGYNDFSTSSRFQTYLEETVLPNITLNNPSAALFNSDSSATHESLISTLGWGYFLNTSSSYGTTDPSSYLAEEYAKTVYKNETFNLENGLNVLESFLWNEYSTVSALNTQIVPELYVSGSSTYASGTQQLDKLKTLISIVYNKDLFNKDDTYIQENFEIYNTLSSLITTKEPNGPFSKLLKAFGYFLTDRGEELEKLQSLYDIENCPEEYLSNLADLIGWKLIGTDTSRWRSQLRTAVEIYKAKGTIKSIQLISDTIFGTSVFDVSSENILELYESYIPNLIYFALATDSLAFADKGNNWTPEVAQFLGVQEYSTKGVDFNLRLAVDYILLDLYNNYPTLFKIGTSQFRVGEGDFVFNYRGRDFPIPPWEEEKYYVFCNITNKFLDYLKERLICFGVSETLAEEIRQFIYDNTISSPETYSVESQWVFFTSSQEYPSTYEDVLCNPEEKRVEYLPLWNGKSSHITLPFFVSSFDFTVKKSNQPDTAYALQDLAAGIDQVLPANVIPNIILSLSGVIDEVSFEDLLCPVIVPTTEDVYEGSSYAFTNYMASGADMSLGNKTFKRWDVDELTDSLVSSTSLVEVPRNAIRRRSYQKLFPKNGFFNRYGFNMPSTWAPSAIEYSCSSLSSVCWLPLGYNPSDAQYTPVEDPLNPSGVWSICANLNSSSNYFGIDVSNTFPTRGRDLTTFSGCDQWTTRDLLDDILLLMWRVQEDAARETAEQTIALNPSAYEYPEWADHETSTINDIISRSSYSVSNIENFEFGMELHRLYNIYTTHFSDLGLAEKLLTFTEFISIINHVYGSILYNSKFDIDGSAITTDPGLISSSVGEINFFTTSPSNVFTGYGSSIGSTYSNIDSDIIISPSGEYLNPHILSGVEFVMTASGTTNNRFAVLRVDETFEKTNKPTYHLENSMIYFRNVQGLPRVRFNLQDFGTSGNFLLPENEFVLDLSTYGAKEDGLTVGGYEFGIWIHTESESGQIWTLTNSGSWKRVSNTPTVNQVLTEYAHLFSVPEEAITDTTNAGFRCVDFKIVEVGGELIPQTIQNLTEDEVIVHSLGFNTKNLPICVPRDYYNTYGQVHSKTRNYIVEIFMLPRNYNSDRFMILDEIKLYNKTLNEKAIIKSSLGIEGDELYPASSFGEYNKTLLPDELLKAFRYFKSLAQNNASRVATSTSGTFEVSGGSRTNYRVHPDWANIATEDTAGENNYTNIDLQGF